MRSRDGSEAYPAGRTDRAWALTEAERENGVEKASQFPYLDDQYLLKMIRFSLDTLDIETSGRTEEGKVALKQFT